MKRSIFLLLASLSSISLFSQVGIGTPNPQATLEIAGKPAIATSMDGIIPPKLTGAQLRTKTYTTAQSGAIVYVTAADISPAGQTVNVTSTGHYSFDGNVWIKLQASKFPTSQLVLLVRGTGTQLNTVSLAGPSSARLAYFSNSAVQGGTTDVINDPGSWNPTTQSYIAPVAGTYQIVATVILGNCAGAADNASAFIRTILKSAATGNIININTADIRYTNGLANSNQSTTINLNAGDQISFDYLVGGATYCSASNSNIQRLAIYRFQ